MLNFPFVRLLIVLYMQEVPGSNLDLISRKGVKSNFIVCETMRYFSRNFKLFQMQMVLKSKYYPIVAGPRTNEQRHIFVVPTGGTLRLP